MTSTDHTTYLTAAETAKYLRKAIKARWPHTKFSVRSRTYAGGASIHVRWTDGPADDEVTPVLNRFEGARFDGMIDMQTGAQHWLLPNGTIELAEIRGTEGSRGTIPDYVTDAPHPNAVLVSLGSHYVFGSRSITNSEQQIAAARAIIETECVIEGVGVHARFGNQWVQDLAHATAYCRRESETLHDSFERVVLCNGQARAATVKATS